MPFTLNGIGTGYWGKRNIHKVPGSCESCGKSVELSSYDTRNCFVILFLPVIPLDRKRILNQCPACSRHQVVPLGKWNAERERDSGEALAAARSRPDDPEAAAQALQTLITYQDANRFAEAAPAMETRHKQHAEVLKVLGVGHEYFGNTEAAERAYRQALSVKNDPDARGLLAARLLRNGSLDEARPLIERNLAELGEQAAGDVLSLVRCYQVEGRHEEALTVLQALTAAVPDAVTDKQVAKLEKASRKRVGTRKPIKHARLKGSGGGSTSQGSRQIWKIALVGCIAALVLGSWLYTSYDQGRHQAVHLVNGLGVEYTVEINGEMQRLRPNARVMIQLPHGEITVDPARSGLPLDPATVTIDTPFLTRAFRDHLFVLNPDRTALLIWEETVYSEGGTADDAAEPRVHTGQVLHEFDGVDYVFRAFPEEIKIDGNKARRQRLDLLAGLHPMLGASYLTASGGDTVKPWLARRTRLEPDNREVLAAVVNFLEPDDALALLRPGLEARPVRVEWHRMYQSLMETVSPDVDLVAEYDALLRDDAHDPVLLYLRGRATADAVQAASFFRRALEQEGDVSYAANSLAYQDLASGAFGDALTLVSRALEIHPDHPSFHAVRNASLLAAGRYEERLQAVRDTLAVSPFDLDLASEGIFLLSRLGREAEIDLLIGRVTTAYRQEDRTEAAAVERYLVSQQRYIAGDLDGHAEALTDHPWVESAWQVLVDGGNLEAAHELLRENEFESPDAQLVLALAACLGSDATLAERLVGEAIDALREGDSAQRLLAAHLAGETTDTAQLLALAHEVPEKRLVLAVLLARGRDDARLRSLAAKLNYDGRFPHHLVEDAVTR